MPKGADRAVLEPQQGIHCAVKWLSSCTVPGYTQPVRKTTIEIDDALVARASSLLGTRGLKATVQRALEEIVARDARLRFADRLRQRRGLDRDKPAVMDRAWR